VTMTRSYVWRDPSMSVTWLNLACRVGKTYHITMYVMTWLLYMCDMTHLWAWHDSTSPLSSAFKQHCYVCGDMTPSYVWHDSSMSVTWRNLASSVSVPTTLLCMWWHDSSVCVTQ